VLPKETIKEVRLYSYYTQPSKKIFTSYDLIFYDFIKQVCIFKLNLFEEKKQVTLVSLQQRK